VIHDTLILWKKFAIQCFALRTDSTAIGSPNIARKEPQTNGKHVRDNHGEIELSTQVLRFTPGNTKIKYVECTIEPAHAGDNDIVTMHPSEAALESFQFQSDGETLERLDNNGGWQTLDKNLQTDTLISTRRKLMIWPLLRDVYHAIRKYDISDKLAFPSTQEHWRAYGLIE
jgi:hypothetical protein